MRTVLRISNESLSGGYVDFYEEEVLGCVYDETYKEKLYHLETGYFRIIRTNQKNKTLQVTFRRRLEGYNTMSKLEQVYNLQDSFGHPSLITIYYEYALDPLNGLLCQMKRDDFNRIYAMGYQADETLQITFEGASTGIPALGIQSVGA